MAFPRLPTAGRFSDVVFNRELDIPPWARVLCGILKNNAASGATKDTPPPRRLRQCLSICQSTDCKCGSLHGVGWKYNPH
jgi:hypothetical protein